MKYKKGDTFTIPRERDRRKPRKTTEMLLPLLSHHSFFAKNLDSNKMTLFVKD
jgi:hypothetical protein